MLFKRISAAILCAVAMSLAAPDADSGEDMMIFKAILQSPIFKDNFVQSCTAQSMEWLGASQADKTCNCAFDRMVKDSKFINRILSSINSENIFPIIKKWMYSDHDIFYRELVSNGCDAVTKLKKLDAFIGYEDGTVKHIKVR